MKNDAKVKMSNKTPKTLILSNGVVIEMGCWNSTTSQRVAMLISSLSTSQNIIFQKPSYKIYHLPSGQNPLSYYML